MAALLLIPTTVPAVDTGETDHADRFSREELTQILAPIALYPDSLIAQILMASTYPLEVVDAERWLRQNRDMDENELDEALRDKPWDTSVKSLCHFPDLLIAMSDKLDQTTKLGDAFLSQEDDVMAEIQELRARAESQGNLRNSQQQRVINEGDVIQIEPAEPDLVYVPVYDPMYVYGPWWYPAFPPFYWYFPSDLYFTGGFIGFGPGIFLGFNIFSWTWFDWHDHRIHLDYNRTRRFDRGHFRSSGTPSFWRHNPAHRRGVAYRDRGTSQRFGAGPGRTAPRGMETRGYPAGGLERRIRGDEATRPSMGRGAFAGGPQTRSERSISQSVPRSYNPFRGIGNGNFERRAGERGIESRRSSVISPRSSEARPYTREMRPQSRGGISQPTRQFIRSGGGVSNSRVISTPRGGGIGRSGGGSVSHGGGNWQRGGSRR